MWSTSGSALLAYRTNDAPSAAWSNALTSWQWLNFFCLVHVCDHQVNLIKAKELKESNNPSSDFLQIDVLGRGKVLAHTFFFTSILNLWRISYFLRFFNWLHGSCKPCADVSVGGRFSLLLAELECSLGLMELAKKRTSCQLTPLRGKSSATYPTHLKTHALAHAVCMCKNEQERTRMHRCDFPCWRHSHSPFACPCHLHQHLWPTPFQVLL